MFAVWPLIIFDHFLIVLEKQDLQWLSVLDFALKRKINIMYPILCFHYIVFDYNSLLSFR